MERDRVHERVLELAHVARPGVARHHLERVRRERERLAGRVLLEEVGGEQRQVIAAIAERRDLQHDDVEPVEQILAEPVLLHGRTEIDVGRGDHADVDGARGAPADRPHLALLEDAQQARLDGHRHVADLVEEQRAAVGLDEHARAIGGGASERALRVPEQLAVDQRLRDGAAVERDEPLLAARAALVQRARHQLLAGAALAADQDRDVLARQAIERGAQLTHLGRHADEQRVRGGRPLGATELAPQRGVASRGLHHRCQLERPERLGQVVERAGAHARGGGGRGVVAGEHDDRRERVGLAKPVEHVDAAHAGQADVE